MPASLLNVTKRNNITLMHAGEVRVVYGVGMIIARAQSPSELKRVGLSP